MWPPAMTATKKKSILSSTAVRILRKTSAAVRKTLLKPRVLHECLNEMGEREQYIIKSRMLTDKPVTLEEIGVKFGISRERVRQIEKKAFEKLSALVKLELAQKMC